MEPHPIGRLLARRERREWRLVERAGGARRAARFGHLAVREDAVRVGAGRLSWRGLAFPRADAGGAGLGAGAAAVRAGSAV